MTTLTEHVDVKCPHHEILHHAERYFTVHRRGQTPGTFPLTVDLSSVGLPAKIQARHDVKISYAIQKGPDGHDAIALTWDPGDRFVPQFTGLLTGDRLVDGKSRVTLSGSYTAPLGPVGAVFDAVLGKKIASATAAALLQDVKQFIESDYQSAETTTLASSPKE